MAQTALKFDAYPMAVIDRKVRSPIFDRWVLGGSLVCFVITFLSCFYYIEEDAYIYFRLAENIAQGNGYVFNVGGERIEGGSSPLWLLFLVALVSAGFDAVIASKLLGFIFGFATVVLVYVTAMQLSVNRYLAAVSAITLCFSTPFIYWANAGLDAPLYSVFLLGFVFCLWKADVPLLAGIIGLTLLARPEAIVVVPVTVLVVGLSIRKNRKRRLISLAIGLMSYVVYLLFRLWYFNDLQISPFYAKPQSRGFSLSNVLYFIHNYNLHMACLALLLLPFLSAAQKKNLDFVLIGFLILVLSIMFAGSNFDFKLFHRFYVPCIPLVLLLSALSSSLLIDVIDERIKDVAIGIFSLTLLSAIFVPNPAPFYKAAQGLNPMVNGASVIFEQGFDYHSLLTKTKQGDVIRDFSIPDQPETLKNVTFYMNYQAQVGFLINDIAPQGALMAYDQMGQTAYFSGADKVYIDMLGIMDKRIGLYYFVTQGRHRWLNKLYLDLMAWIIPQRPKPLRKDELESYLFQHKPDLILINSIVATFKSESLARLLLPSLTSNENYIQCGSFSGLVSVYKRKDLKLNLPKPRYGDFTFQKSGVESKCF